MSVFRELKTAALSHGSQPAVAAEDAGAAPVTETPRPERKTIPWKAVALQAAGIWLASRIALFIFTYFAVILNAQGTNAPVNLRKFGPSALLNAWDQWDVDWYTGIALHGYRDWKAAAFFPFFPLMTHLLTVVIGPAHVLGAAMIVSNVGTLVAFVAIGWLAAWEFGPHVSRWAVIAAAAYPFSFFTFAGYSDGWFLAWCALTLLFARRTIWLGAAACAFMASISRPTAVVLIAPLLWEYGRELRARRAPPGERRTIRDIGEGIAVVGVVPLGFALIGLYQWMLFRNPFEWVKAQESWGHDFVMPWRWVQIALDKLQYTPAWTFPQARVLMDLGTVVLFAGLTLWGARHLPAALTIYMLAVIGVLVTAAVPADFDPFNAEARYLIMSVPIFLLLGRWMTRRPWLHLLVVGGGFMLQGALTVFWLRGGWIV